MITIVASGLKVHCSEVLDQLMPDLMQGKASYKMHKNLEHIDMDVLCS